MLITEINLILLFITAAVKICILIAISTFLIRKWHNQPKKYYTDFPFLNALGFYTLALAKMVDIYLYYHFMDTPNLSTLNDPVALLLGKFRFILSPIIVILPYFILMLVIWFGGRKKLQKGLGIGWITLSIIAILLARDYKQFLFFNLIIAFPVVILSIISFAIIHHQRKLPQINSFLITIGWSTYLITQIIRPFWISLGTGVWGLTWVGELVELVTMVFIGIGFIIPAFYAENQKHIAKSNLISDQIQDNLDSIEDCKYSVECYIP